MSNTFQVTFDAADPLSLGQFWAEALDYVLEPPPQGYESWDEFADAHAIPIQNRGDLAAVVDPQGDGPRLLLQRVPESKTTKNRVHLDVNVSRPGTAVEQRAMAVRRHVAKLVDLGATRLETFDRHGEYWTVMQDPEGNEFCVQ